MHRSIGNIIADTLELSLGYSERLLSGISPERFSRFADVGGVIIHSNHPCFIYGHLSLYAPRVTEQLGQSAIAVSDRFSKVFSKDSICVDDPSSDYYPPFMEVISFFRDSYRQSVAALRVIGFIARSAESQCWSDGRTFPNAGISPQFLLWWTHHVTLGPAECLASHGASWVGMSRSTLKNIWSYV